MARLPTAHVVVDHAHLDTLTGFLHQRIGYQAPQGIVLDDIHVDMDMVFRLVDVFQQFREEGIAVGHDVDLIILEGECQVLVDEKVDQRLVVLGHLEVVLFHETEHRTFRQLVERTLADQLLLSVVETEEEVEDDAHDRYEEDDQRPGHGLGGLLVVHHHVDNGYGDGYPRENDTYDI